MKMMNGLFRRRAAGTSGQALFVAATLGLSPLALAAGTEAPATSSASAPVAARLGFRPVEGQQMSFRVSARGVATVNLERLAATLSPTPSAKPREGRQERHEFEVSALVGMQIVGREGGEWITAVRLAEPRYLVDGNADGRIAALESPFVVRFSDRGEMRRFEFPVKFPQDAELAIRALVEPLQVVFSPRDENTWVTNESSVHGTSRVEYAVEAVDKAAGVARLSRKVKAAERALLGASSGQDLTAFKTEVQASSGTIEWALDGSGLRTMNVQEATTSAMGRGAVASSTLSFTARRVNDRIAGLPATLASARTALTVTSFARASYYTVHPSFVAQLEGVDFRTALEQYKLRVNGAPPETNIWMQMFLRKHPEHAREFARALDEHARNPRTEALENVVGYGYAVLAAAGHTEAQQALADTLGDTSAAPLTQQKVLDAMLSIELPERFIPGAIWSFRERLPQTGPTRDPVVLSIVTNVYGSVGNVDRSMPENTKEVVGNLARLLQSSNTEDKALALVALGNIGDPSLTLPLAERYLTSSNDELRVRAFDAFVQAKAPAHFARYAAAVAAERVPWVRRDATAIAMRMPDSPERNQWAAELARTSGDSIIQMRCVHILGRAMAAYPENRKLLEGLLEKVGERDVRKAIYSYTLNARGGAR